MYCRFASLLANDWASKQASDKAPVKARTGNM
jgi:hypothetical protein